MRALDVGSGSGYLSACMAIMVGASGKVVGIGRTFLLLLFLAPVPPAAIKEIVLTYLRFLIYLLYLDDLVVEQMIIE